MNECSECKHFYDGPGETDECRRFPPTLFRRPSGADFAFPNTTVSDWCGEFSKGAPRRAPGTPTEKQMRSDDDASVRAPAVASDDPPAPAAKKPAKAVNKPAKKSAKK